MHCHNDFQIERIRARAAALCVALFVSACGGGDGGDGTPAAAPPPSGGGGVTPPPSTPGAQRLQTHLSACPNAFTINESVSCMVGLYEGKTTDTGAYCAFNYDKDGVAFYITGTQTLRAGLSILSSGAVFEKKVASNSAGFSIAWSIGIASGNDMDVYYRSSSEPASADGLLIKPKKTSVPACLVSAGPAVAATGSASTANLLGRTWQTPQLLNGSAGALGYFSDQPAFDAGLADDGRAFITFRQPDAAGRMAVHVIDGRPGAAGQNAEWSAPQVLDADAPLLAGNFRPRIAVSSTGHAAVAWMTERPCEADAYEAVPAGKTCRYLYASRRLASESSWEPAKRVRASPPMAAQDHFVRINARGDVVIVLPSFDPLFQGSTITKSALAIRPVADSAYRATRMAGFWSNSLTTTPFSQQVQSEIDDDANLFVAGDASSPFDISYLRTTTTAALDAPLGNTLPVISADGVEVYELRTGATGFAAFTWRDSDGSRRSPSKLTLYTPNSQAWLAAYDINAYTLWGETALASTDNAAGEFLLYSGCKLTVWRAGTWGATRDLPTYCGRDQAGGVYAFNRKGDYLGLNWAGKPGQWGYYSYAQDKLLKGAPGSGNAVSGDFVLGTASNLFGAQPTQLLLAANGLALAVASNTYTSLPSASNAAGVSGGTAIKLWAVYLK